MKSLLILNSDPKFNCLILDSNSSFIVGSRESIIVQLMKKLGNGFKYLGTLPEEIRELQSNHGFDIQLEDFTSEDTVDALKLMQFNGLFSLDDFVLKFKHFKDWKCIFNYAIVHDIILPCNQGYRVNPVIQLTATAESDDWISD